MATKLRMKVGSAEFDWDGTAEITLSEIKEMLEHMVGLVSAQTNANPNVEAHAEGAEASGAGHKGGSGKPLQKLHIASVASKLKAKTGPDLALSAAAVLQIFDGKESFTRAELAETMKKATMHYKSSMLGNLTSILQTLIGNKFNQIGDGVYSLSADEFESLKAQLA